MRNDIHVHSICGKAGGYDIVLTIHCDDQKEYDTVAKRLNLWLPTELPSFKRRV